MTAGKSNIAAKIKMFTHILYGVKCFRVVLFFYSFLSFVFWFLNCLETEWLYLFNWLFIVPYRIVSMFYRPEGVSSDFSLAIIGGIALLAGFLSEFFVNSLNQMLINLENEQQRRIQIKRMHDRERHMKKVAKAEGIDLNSPLSGIIENSKLVFLIMPRIKKIKRTKEDMEYTFQELESWKLRINKKLLENIAYTKPMQKGYYRKNLFLMYSDFNYTDDFIYYISPTLDAIAAEFKGLGANITFCCVMSALTQLSLLEKELDCMDTILSLNFDNDIIVTDRFRISYDSKNSPQYRLVLKGEYNLSKNLSVTNKQELYALKDAVRKDK